MDVLHMGRKSSACKLTLSDQIAQEDRGNTHISCLLHLQKIKTELVLKDRKESTWPMMEERLQSKLLEEDDC